MSSMYEGNVVVLHNVNAFGANRDAPPNYEEVFGFSDPRCDTWGEPHLEVVFAIGNGMPQNGWHQELSEAYYAREIRSLSVSDVVFINGTFYRCDSTGWTNIGNKRPA